MLVDGAPLSFADLRRWSRQIGYVPQDIFLCDESILKNIALGIPDAAIDREAAIAAARIAKIDDFIQSELPAGYDTVIGTANGLLAQLAIRPGAVREEQAE